MIKLSREELVVRREQARQQLRFIGTILQPKLGLRFSQPELNFPSPLSPTDASTAVQRTLHTPLFSSSLSSGQSMSSLGVGHSLLPPASSNSSLTLAEDQLLQMAIEQSLSATTVPAIPQIDEEEQFLRVLAMSSASPPPPQRDEDEELRQAEEGDNSQCCRPSPIFFLTVRIEIPFVCEVV